MLNSGSVWRPKPLSHSHGVCAQVKRWHDVADMRKREGDELPGIGGIGEDFLVTGHGGVETDLADGVAFGAEAKTLEHRAIGKHQERGRLLVRPGVDMFRRCHQRFTYSS